ncbi:molybdopterin molybdotransferase [Sporobacter termitidis DSM 10068]|uniref:Molybdopterin molybdenumtransferase n=1 Tax=Sporobacter termitidis DSM 10068 TaxID=1123282 RepID=A0A1M5Z3L5_9FIRM|nr:molybdopterin molybdotransferase MoeA [Sporobacter termitidis]SHI18708.1 molybdopterin molybdotransferase [Sporobacter termitidis DSM 10068]
MQGSVVVPPKPCVDACKDCSYQCTQKIVPVPTVGEALDMWLDGICFSNVETETVELSDALNRVSAAPVYAKFDIPAANCAMHDGIAVCRAHCEDKFASGNHTLLPDAFRHCPMGSVIPEQFDSIAHAEQCCLNDDGTATLFQLPVLYQSVQLKGASIAGGEKLMEADEKLSPSHLAILQYTGHTAVRVKRRPRIAVIPVGDDLKAPGEVPAPGQSIDCDSIYVRATALQCGAEAMVSRLVPDDGAAIAEAIRRELPTCDILVVIGGVGKGEHRYGDHTVAAVREMGRISCYGVLLGPGGKNLLLASVEGKPVLGIPGPPHAAIIMTEYFLPPIIEHWLGCPCYERQTVEATLAEDFPTRGGGKSIWEPRLRLEMTGQGYSARIVERMGDTVDNFINAAASVAVTGDPAQFKAGGKVRVKLLYGERTIAAKSLRQLKSHGTAETGTSPNKGE